VVAEAFRLRFHGVYISRVQYILFLVVGVSYGLLGNFARPPAGDLVRLGDISFSG
jgi:hypothetical protein